MTQTCISFDVQLIVGLPFLATNTLAYLKNSFDLSRSESDLLRLCSFVSPPFAECC